MLPEPIFTELSKFNLEETKEVVVVEFVEVAHVETMPVAALGWMKRVSVEVAHFELPPLLPEPDIAPHMTEPTVFVVRAEVVLQSVMPIIAIFVVVEFVEVEKVLLIKGINCPVCADASCGIRRRIRSNFFILMSAYDESACTHGSV